MYQVKFPNAPGASGTRTFTGPQAENEALCAVSNKGFDVPDDVDKIRVGNTMSFLNPSGNYAVVKCLG